MRVVVTGAAGKVGSVVVRRLVQCGHDVVATDLKSGQRADLCDLGQVFGVFAGADAVVHLGAIPAPGGYPPEQVFANNAISQFNVFEACAKLGINRVISASSLSAYGYPFQHRWSEPLYFPLDEEHPLVPQDAYGLSKAIGEQVAAAYARRTGGVAISLRISTVVDEEYLPRLVEIVRGKPEAGASSLWSYIHVDDVARFCEAALTAPVEGHHAVLWTAADTIMDRPTDELLDEWYPSVPRRPRSDESLVDCARARAMFGIAPNFSWRKA
ncbi:NAD-dependent epimerase [Rhizocola hellebori]|uniref:NAD-dependent epimerase n=1 Tax=Rhizocola hellebori TaxID=1392758 RepID=A0A8J3QA37_9ACTN|nr:NAD(P)-dependent oxidoreductase [Rhizocola hellebori]GIH06735.1 NAD-dependent epimerase [Rhizocola hellebori]